MTTNSEDLSKVIRYNKKVLIAVIAGIGVLALAGMIIDLWQIHLERRELKRTVDSAALAGASELPLESAAYERTLRYLQESGYNSLDQEKVRIIANAGDSTQAITGSSEANAVLTIWIDTAFSRDWEAQEPLNTAYSIRVRIKKKIPTIFLRLVGIKQISIEDNAGAWVMGGVLVAVVFDVSGSTRFTTLRSGCWMENCAYWQCWRQYGVENSPGRCSEDSFDVVLDSLDQAQIDGLDLVDGMKMGIDVLSSATGAYEQPRVAHVMLLITDRNPQPPGGELQGQECWLENLWTGDENQANQEQQGADCAIHYARRAEEKNIGINTIGLGSDIDQDLLERIASTTGGWYDWASTPDELDEILDDFFNPHRRRLVQ